MDDLENGVLLYCSRQPLPPAPPSPLSSRAYGDMPLLSRKRELGQNTWVLALATVTQHRLSGLKSKCSFLIILDVRSPRLGCQVLGVVGALVLGWTDVSLQCL